MTTRRFWQNRTLLDFSADEWESLCDGCGLCCLRKLEDEDTGEIAYTDVACQLLDTGSCRCTDYANRTERVADCVRLTPEDRKTLGFMPATCAYRLVDRGEPLPDWHPLVSGSPDSVHAAGISVRGRVVSETEVDEDEVDSRIVDWVGNTD